jgi:hypothetical protein
VIGAGLPISTYLFVNIDCYDGLAWRDRSHNRGRSSLFTAL